MFARVWNALKNPVVEETVQRAGRRYGQHAYKHQHGKPEKPPASSFPWQSSPSTTRTVNITTAPAAQPTNPTKYLRYAFLALGAGYFATRAFRGPDPFGNVLSTPVAAKAKYSLTIEKLDDKIANYQTSYLIASEGMRPALIHQTRNITLQRIGLKLDDLTVEQITQLQVVGKAYDDAMKTFILPILEEISKNQLQILSLPTTTEPEKEEKKKIQEKHIKQLVQVLEKKIELEMNLLDAITTVFRQNPKSQMLMEKDNTLIQRMKNMFLGLQGGGKYEFLMEKISKVASLPSFERSKVFVLEFDGDLLASGVARLREEITAVLNIANAKRGDRVIIQLNSPGGTVTGYGLGASQIARLKNAGFHVTISVDEVAASGGYMMACVADRIVASPFAIIGSIGVVQTMPNFSEFLERHGVTVEDVTAGKFKRTMTPYKKSTDEDRNKVKSDLEAVFTLFRDFIKTNRPQVNIEEVATGEIWHATDAIKKGLIDQLLTTDDLLLQSRDAGFDVFKLSLRPVNQYPGLFGSGGDAPGLEYGSFTERVASWLSSIMKKVILDIVQKEFMKTPFGMLENQHYQQQGIEEDEGSLDIRKNILGIDSSNTKFPPKF